MKKRLKVSVVKVSLAGKVSKKELGVVNTMSGMSHMDIVYLIANLLPKRLSLKHRRMISEIIQPGGMSGGVKSSGKGAIIYLASYH